jgi:hypothetical protein
MGGVYGVYVVMIVPLRRGPGRLILAGVPWVTSWFLCILLGYNTKSLSELDYLVLYTKLSSCLWAPQVRSGRVHGQVGGSSGRSGPPVGDDGDPSRWGPVGTHVSHKERPNMVLEVVVLHLERSKAELVPFGIL